MALNYFIGTSCTGQPSRFFATTAVIQTNKIYELLAGATNIGCWTLYPYEETDLAQVVTVFNGPWENCIDCGGDLTPTPTGSPTSTPTNTPSNTPTNTPTPTNTQTPTQTQTGTPTNTPTPSITASNTPTPSITSSPTLTPTNTPSSTPTQTPTNTSTQTQTPTNTPTPTTTTTPTATPTQTATQTATPTPTPTPFGVFEVNEQYEANACVDCDGVITTPPYPHPADWVPVGPDGEKQGTVIDLSAVQLGGMHGLNN
jgi:hypothetical protein